MRVTGIRSERSVGIVRYCTDLADALTRTGFQYRTAATPVAGTTPHWHLGNSSRGAIVRAPLGRMPYVVTVHDVVPRTRALAGVYRALAYPGVVRRAARVVVHSRFAADLLLSLAGLDHRQIEVIPHGAPCRVADRAAARRRLGWPPGERIAVLPGVVKGAKLVDLAIDAVAPLTAAGSWRLALAGRVGDRSAADRAAVTGSIVLEAPDDEAYDDAVAAADAVLVLRAGSVGETNGPLLDAFGAGRAVIATASGSIAELADEAAMLIEPTLDTLRKALIQLSDNAAREELEARSGGRGRAFSWEASAAAHAELFDGVAT